MVPSQHQRIDDWLVHEVKKLGMNRFDLLKRNADLIKMSPNRFENLRKYRIIDCFDQA